MNIIQQYKLGPNIIATNIYLFIYCCYYDAVTPPGEAHDGARSAGNARSFSRLYRSVVPKCTKTADNSSACLIQKHLNSCYFHIYILHIYI